MSNGDESMSPEEFAKLMGAYPEPAGNPLPAYGGYMDNSPANFAWVQNNDYFGAEEGQGKTYFITDLRWEVDDDPSNPRMGYVDNPEHTDETTEDEIFEYIANSVEHTLAWRGNEVINATYEIKPLGYEDADYEQWKKENPNWDEDNLDYGAEVHLDGSPRIHGHTKCDCDRCERGREGFYPHGWTCQYTGVVYRYKDAEYHFKNHAVTYVEANDEDEAWDIFSGIDPAEDWDIEDMSADTDLTPTNQMNNSIGQVVPITNPMELPTNLIETEAGGGPEGQITPDTFEATPKWECDACGEMHDDEDEAESCCIESCDHAGDAEMQSWGGAYSGSEFQMYCNVCGADGYGTFGRIDWSHDDKTLEHERTAETFEAPYGGLGAIMDIGKSTPLADFTDEELTTSSAIHGDFDQASLNYSGHQNIEVKAEMEELTETMVDVSNRFGDSVGRIIVDDEEDTYEDVSVEVMDIDGNVIHNLTMEDTFTPDDYEGGVYYAESKTPSIPVLIGGGILTLVAWMNKDKLWGATKAIFNTDTQEVLENDPELVENPDTEDLDPAAYEELVVESTGYAVDIIPMGLDPSFMGSRFAALPTERYVEYNDPGIGAHTDIAMKRDEIYLEPEMAMVQASEENEVKEAQAPGQSPYMSVDGQEPKDFNYRVIKETHPVSLDPAVKPFIPQSMTGYTGNSNTPPSVYNKMFNIGVLGQTPAFVAGESDMGANHFGSRDAKPDMLGIGGSVGGPLSDEVNANYTDGTTSMSLAQWAIENTVSQSSDTEAVVVDRSSGAMKRIRRV